MILRYFQFEKTSYKLTTFEDCCMCFVSAFIKIWNGNGKDFIKLAGQKKNNQYEFSLSLGLCGLKICRSDMQTKKLKYECQIEKRKHFFVKKFFTNIEEEAKKIEKHYFIRNMFDADNTS